MFPTIVLFFCSFVAAFQSPISWMNIVIKASAACLAAWAAMYAAVYCGLAQ